MYAALFLTVEGSQELTISCLQGRGGGGRGGGRGGGQGGRDQPERKREAILDLSKYADKRVRVKFSGGREGDLL